MHRSIAVLAWSALVLGPLGALFAAQPPLVFDDPAPQRYEFTARASQLDPRAREHPEIGFVFSKQGKPSDIEHAMVDTRVPPRGELVVWLMGYSGPLFERTTSYGLHSIQVHYANGWFGQLAPLALLASPQEDKFLGKIRLEAATGEDFTQVVSIPKPDGMMERAFQLVKWLDVQNPQGRWGFFLTDDKQGLRWDRVIIAGSSHGSTTAARFAIHQRVSRVVMFCGPRDQYETWQGLPAATPTNRFFGFSHVLDGGWTEDHYCRSWELLGLNRYGPIVNVDQSSPPYGNTRRLITAADVKHDARRAHSSVVPGRAAVPDASGKFVHEAVWRYLFTHPVDVVGEPVPADADCRKDQRPSRGLALALDVWMTAPLAPLAPACTGRPACSSASSCAREKDLRTAAAQVDITGTYCPFGKVNSRDGPLAVHGGHASGCGAEAQERVDVRSSWVMPQLLFTGDENLNVGNSKNRTVPWMNLLCVTLVGVAVGAWGCSKAPSGAEHDHAHHAHGTSQEIQARLAQLSDEDRTLAEAQAFCAVNSNNELGSTGVPYKLTIEGRPVFLCCEHCKDAALKDPQATLARLDGLLQNHSAHLQTNTK